MRVHFYLLINSPSLLQISCKINAVNVAVINFFPIQCVCFVYFIEEGYSCFISPHSVHLFSLNNGRQIFFLVCKSLFPQIILFLLLFPLQEREQVCFCFRKCSMCNTKYKVQLYHRTRMDRNLIRKLWVEDSFQVMLYVLFAVATFVVLQYELNHWLQKLWL